MHCLHLIDFPVRFRQMSITNLVLPIGFLHTRQSDFQCLFGLPIRFRSPSTIGWSMRLWAFALATSVIASGDKPAASCMPPPRQQRVLPPPLLPKAGALPPLNEGFARPVPATRTAVAGDSTSSSNTPESKAQLCLAFGSTQVVSPASSSNTPIGSGWQPPRRDGQEVLPYARL